MSDDFVHMKPFSLRFSDEDSKDSKGPCSTFLRSRENIDHDPFDSFDFDVAVAKAVSTD